MSEREQFEAWWNTAGRSLCGCSLVPDHSSPNQVYAARGFGAGFAAGFEAARAQPQQPQAEVGNSGFDHKTASDFLSGKTVSDEAVRKFAQASRWAHDDRASLQSMLLSVRNELASREAEIALLKKELMEAEATPQQTEAVPSESAVVAGARVLNQRAAESCGVNADDQWAIYAENFKDDVRAVLTAAQGEKP